MGPIDMLLGAHESIAGGLEKAFAHAEDHGDEAIQIFTKNASQWKEPVLASTQVTAFRAAHASWGGRPVISHGSYLVNLSAERPDMLERSRLTVVAEMERCDQLGVTGIALHPGAAVGLSEKDAIDRIAEGFDMILERTKGMSTRLCIENTAGQGSTIGWSLDQIATILAQTSQAERIGICLDTQHLFAAGYDLRTQSGYDAFFAEFDAKIGIHRVVAFHLNDSKKPLGERVDRHEEIGTGEIGLYPFWRLMNDARFKDTAGIVELPLATAATSMARLKAMRGAPEPARKPMVAPLALTAPVVAKAPRRAKSSAKK